jgi:TRAP-type uncharacterized transport system substrate-binding protein
MDKEPPEGTEKAMTIMRRATLAGLGVGLLLLAVLRTPAGAAQLRPEDAVNRGVVELETESASGISVRIAEDLAHLIDDGTTRRVIPVVGKAALQNIADLKLLRGIDLALLQTDVLDYARQKNLYPGIENSITYIAKLYNAEFHLLARPEIKSVGDLAGKKVNVDVIGASTAITAGRIFELLNITVATTNDIPEVALDKLRKGEIAALAFMAGKPAPFIREVGGEDGLHLIAVPLSPAVAAVYVPTRFTAEDYPALVAAERPVDTVAVGTVLAVANLQGIAQRYRNVANFVDAFFSGFQSLLEPGNHAKWREVNIAAEFPGWQRFRPAEEWLQRNAQPAVTADLRDLKTIFMHFIEERQQASGGSAMSQNQKDELFKQFELWQKGPHR